MNTSDLFSYLKLKTQSNKNISKNVSSPTKTSKTTSQNSSKKNVLNAQDTNGLINKFGELRFDK